MKFELTAKVDKGLWSNGQAFLYKVVETFNDKETGWTVFTKQELAIGQSYKFSGYVTSSKDKKRVTSDNKAIYNTSFNAETIEENESFPF